MGMPAAAQGAALGKFIVGSCGFCVKGVWRLLAPTALKMPCAPRYLCRAWISISCFYIFTYTSFIAFSRLAHSRLFGIGQVVSGQRPVSGELKDTVTSCDDKYFGGIPGHPHHTIVGTSSGSHRATNGPPNCWQDFPAAFV